MAKRLRKTRKWGSQIIVPLNAIDVKDMDIEPGDEVDIADIVIKEQSKTKKRGERK